MLCLWDTLYQRLEISWFWCACLRNNTDNGSHGLCFGAGNSPKLQSHISDSTSKRYQPLLSNSTTTTLFEIGLLAIVALIHKGFCQGTNMA